VRYFIFQPTLVINLSWSVYHAYKSYRELIPYLPNNNLELYFHSFLFCFSHCNFIIKPTLMIILLWSCIIMNKLNMMVIIFLRAWWFYHLTNVDGNFIVIMQWISWIWWWSYFENMVILSYDQHWWWDYYNWVLYINKLAMMTIILKYVCD
jgi:hypothetical protein